MMTFPGKSIFGKRNLVTAGLIALGLVGLVSIQDLVEASIKNYNFYLSESLLFNSFYLLFLPLLFVQKKCLAINPGAGKMNPLFVKLLIVVSASVVHLLLFPLIVLLISMLFFDHTFSFRQTLLYAISNNLYICLGVYGIAALLNQYYGKGLVKEDKVTGRRYLEKIDVGAGVNHTMISVNDIACFRSEKQYIAVHTSTGKFLIAGTLKGMTGQLDPGKFIRVHKSAILNLTRIVSYKSRQNGDYDVMLDNGMEIRMSRNYAPGFKSFLNMPSA